MPDDTPPTQPDDADELSPEELLPASNATRKMTGSSGGGLWEPPTVEQAEQLFPNYEVLSLLGRGGMGAVYKARQLALDRLVAIKLLPLEVSVDRDFADRFVREARAMGRLNHPNIIAVYDFGQTSEGHLYFAMEFVEGTNLHQIIHGPGLEPAQAFAIIGEVCDALAYAHGKGVVHRDIKPANVMVNTEGRVKVADFGLARLTDPSAEQYGRTQTGIVMGTPDYMAPEQKRGMNVDHRADIYSLGVMLYEMLCKETPQGVFDPPSHRVPVDARIDQVVVKAMQQTPERRFQSSTELKTAVETIRAMPAPRARSAPTPSAPPAQKSRTMLYAGAGVAAVIVLLVAVFAISGGEKKRRTAVVTRPTPTALPQTPPATRAPISSSDARAASPRPASPPAETSPSPMPATPPPAAVIAATPASPGSRAMFDGKSFAGWHGYAETGAPTGFRVQEGLLIGDGRRKTLVTDELFGDFELSLEWRAGSGGNGGIFYLVGSPASGDRVIDCPELNLMDDALSANNKTGSLFNVQEATKAVAKPLGEWNTARLVYRGGKAEHWVNDQLVCAYDLTSTKFSAKAGTKGKIGLQGWTGEIAYRNVMLRSLDPVEVAPAIVPVPTPATTPAPSVTGKWLGEQVPQWEAAFAKEVIEPFEKGVGDLRKQYLAALDNLLATATRTGKLDDAVVYRADRERMAGGGEVLAEDEALAPAALRTLRASYRTPFAKLDAERFAKATRVHARYDAILAQNQTALTQRQRLDEALELKAKRDALSAAWLKPPVGAVASATPASAAATPAPVMPKPALGQTAPPPPSKTPKLKPRELVEHLLAMGASITGAVPGSPLTTVDKIIQFPGDGFVIDKVIFPKPREGLTEADLDVLQQLDSIADLHLNGLPATDATIERLWRLPKLRALTLRPPNNITAAGFRTIAELPALQVLDVGIPISTECLVALGKARQLNRLLLFGTSFTEQDFAAIAAIPTLRSLTLITNQVPPPEAWARLSSAKNLIDLNIGQAPTSAAMIVEISKLSGLEALTLGRITFPDAEFAPLGALKSLQHLRTGNGSTLDGSVFATWPLRPNMRSLSLISQRSVSDDALRAIAAAFPKLERLDVNASADSVTAAGFAHLTKLKDLGFVDVTGDALDDAALAHLAKCDLLYYLGLGNARVSEAGVQSLPKLSALRDLNWINPPVTEAALKSYGKLRSLTQFRIGPETTVEIEKALQAALPKVRISR